MQEIEQQTVMVLGAGNFGTCLAHHLGSLGHKVFLWTRNGQQARKINETHRNPECLSEIALSENITATTDLTQAVFSQCSAIVITIPTQSLRAVLGEIQPLVTLRHLIVSAAKGIEIGSDKLPKEIISDTLGDAIANKAVSLSGPSFAVEVARHLPTAVAVASHDVYRALQAQRLFHAPHFRAYTSDDPIGLEVAGALKNVIALCAGACAGLGFQANSLAGLITRGLAEMTRVGVALGAKPMTFIGLGGVGDLFLTCSSPKSRNYTVGFRLGKGERLEDIMSSVGSVAEGVPTTKSAYHLGNQLGVSIPIITAVYQVLYENRPLEAAYRELLTRNARQEG